MPLWSVTDISPLYTIFLSFTLLLLTRASHTSTSSAWNLFHPTIVHLEYVLKMVMIAAIARKIHSSREKLCARAAASSSTRGPVDVAVLFMMPRSGLLSKTEVGRFKSLEASGPDVYSFQIREMQSGVWMELSEISRLAWLASQIRCI